MTIGSDVELDAELGAEEDIVFPFTYKFGKFIFCANIFSWLKIAMRRLGINEK